VSGRIVHFEVPYDDRERAAAFYGDVFGWDVQHVPDLDYTLASTGPSGDRGPTEPGYINGGMMQRSDAFKGPVITVDVDSIDDALGRVEAAGGKTVFPKNEVPGMGFTAYFTDPEGNLMGLWESAAPSEE